VNEELNYLQTVLIPVTYSVYQCMMLTSKSPLPQMNHVTLCMIQCYKQRWTLTVINWQQSN